MPPPPPASRTGWWPRLRAALDGLGARLGFTSDRRGFARAVAATALSYALLAFYPDRPFRLARELSAWAALAVLLFLASRAARVVREARPLGARPFALALPLVALASACVWPFHSADLYAYANAGWLEAHYGWNPYVHVAREVPGWVGDPMLTDLWLDHAPPYGFLFAHVAHGVARLGGGNLGLTIALFKAVHVAALLFTAAVVGSTARRLGRAHPDLALLLAGLHPFLLVEIASNGHNDVLLALFLVVGLRLLLDGRATPAVLAFAAAVLVKWTAAVTLPFAAVALVRRHGLRRAAVAVLAGVAFAALVSWPYLRDATSFRWDDLGANLSSPASSLAASLIGLVRALARGVPALEPAVEPFRAGLQGLLALGYLAFLGLRVRRAVRRPGYGAPDVIEDAVLALLVLTCVASAKFAPWYVAMFLPAALLLPEEHGLRRLSLLLAAFQLLSITFVGRARILDALLTMGLPLLIFALDRRRLRRGATLSHVGSESSPGARP